MVDTQQWQPSSSLRHLSVTLSLFKPVWTHLALMQQRLVPVHLSSVLLGVDGHRSNAQFSAGSEHTDSDLTWKTRRRREGRMMKKGVILSNYQPYCLCSASLHFASLNAALLLLHFYSLYYLNVSIFLSVVQQIERRGRLYLFIFIFIYMILSASCSVGTISG